MIYSAFHQELFTGNILRCFLHGNRSHQKHRGAMMTYRIGFFFLVMLIPAIMSCGNKRYDPTFPTVKKIPYIEIHNPYGAGRMKTAYIAEKLLDNLKDVSMKEKKIAVLPYYNLEALDQTASFGQYMGEQLISELSELGFNVVEIRNHQAIYMAKKIGEAYILRGDYTNDRPLQKIEIQELRKIFGDDLVGLVCGTYFKGGKAKKNALKTADDLYFVNTRIVRISDSLVVSTASTELKVPIQLSRVKRYNNNPENEIPKISITTVNLSD